MAIVLVALAAFSFAAEQPLYSRDTLPRTVNALALDDSFKTSMFTGAFFYDYNIEVPPGTTGLAPRVSIFYVSQKTSGVPSTIGTGWDITQTYIERDVNETVYATSDDTFTLVLEGSSYDLVLSADNRYRTKIESFLYLENKTGAGNQNSQYWTVREKNGKAYRLGFSNDSEAVSKGANYTWRWYVDLVTDTYNNSILYSYREDPNPSDSNATYLANISYNNDRKRLINFTYESTDRPDIWEVYHSGNSIKYSRRLSEIGVFANSSLVRKYTLQYAVVDTNARTMLSNITRFGSDNATSLAPTLFEYSAVKGGFTNNTALRIPYCILGSDSGDIGTRLVDVNGDGRTDVIRSHVTAGTCEAPTSSIKKALINNGTGWAEDSRWEPSRCITISGSSGDIGVRLADVNGDGLVDIVRSYQGVEGGNCATPDVKWALINNGSGWVQDSRWDPPRCFSHRGTDQGTRFAEANGDGLVDIIVSRADTGSCEAPTTSTKKVFINNGSGWVENSSWTIPNCIVDAGGGDHGVRVIDINGDSLDDIVRSQQTVDQGPCESPDKKWALINNGTGWVEDAKWAPTYCFVAFGGGDMGVRLADINGDSLVDIMRSHRSPGGDCASPNLKKALINNASGWVENVSWEPPYCFINGTADIGTRLADVSGDGLVDIVRSQSHSGECSTSTSFTNVTYENNGNQSYLLSTIRNSQGGQTSVEYRKSTSLNNTGNDTTGDMGFNLWVVSRITQSNGMTGSANVTFAYAYNYSGGLYDYGDQEFRGFNSSQEVRPDSTRISHYFHQDDARTGREYRAEVADSNGSLYQRKYFEWNYTLNASYYITELRSESAYTFDNQSSNPRISNATYRYDSFGNVRERNFSGDVNASGDERYETFQYAYNTTAWIVGTPSYYRLLSANSTLSREVNYSYDDLGYGAVPTKGSLTRKEERVNATSTAITLYGYNANGNVINVTDPNNRTTNFSYGSVDTTFTYPDQETNAKGHVTQYRYDLGLGKITSVTDANNFTTNFTYDVFGRISKEIRPFDSSTYPTRQYEYEADGVAPERTKVLQREQSGTNQTFDAFEFTDGLGNVIQTKRESNSSTQIVLDIVHDGMGRAATRSNPYKTSTQETYTQPNSTVNITNFTYDPVSRVTRIVNPDGTQKTLNHTKWNTTITDENGNRRTTAMDAYGQIIEVVEFNGQDQYRTKYGYDAQGNLANITDSLGNNFTFSYDLLGRKTSMTDPDMGTWSYAYDATGNLIQQKDNRNTTTDLQYDELNRLTRRNSSTEFSNFTYDTGMNGTLSRVESVNKTINLTYDARLRVTKEAETIRNVTRTFNYTYDTMDRITTKFLPGGSNITYTYSDQSVIRSINGFMSNVTYNELDLPERRIYNNTLDTNFTYDPQNLRLARIYTGSLQDLRYTYDNASNVILINDTANLRIYRMAYDALHRLVSANRTDSGAFSYLFNYTYSSTGSILSIFSGQNRIIYAYGSAPVHAPANITTTQAIDLSNLTVVRANGTERIFRFTITNNDSSAISGVSWTLNTGETNLSSSTSATLQKNESMFAYAYFNYTFPDNYTVTATARAGSLYDSESITTNVTVQYLDLWNLSVVHANSTQRVFRFWIRNLDKSSNVTWTLNTGQSNITAQQNTTLSKNETVVTHVYYNYTASGSFTVNATATKGSSQDSETISIQVP